MKIIVWGASGHALVAIDIASYQPDFQIVGLIDDVNPRSHGTYLNDCLILGGREKVKTLQQAGINSAFVAIGNNVARKREGNYLRAHNFDIVTLIHPKSIVATDVSIGNGTMICAGAIIAPGAVIGQDVIINTSTSVDHECAVEDGVHLSPGVHVGGRSHIHQGAWIGIGVTVSDRITIGSSSIIGAGSVVVRDIPDGVLAYGIPAKVIRDINENDF